MNDLLDNTQRLEKRLMKEKLKLITEKVKRDKRLKFTSLIHHINEENLEENIRDLVERLKSNHYRAQPVKRIYIPKPGKANEKRGLGLPTVEDQLVQLMVKNLLEAIFETDFLDYSYGFRPNRNCFQAINCLDKEVMDKPVNFVVEVDIEKCFDRLSHYWLQRCIEERVSNRNLLWLVRRILKAGVIYRVS